MVARTMAFHLLTSGCHGENIMKEDENVLEEGRLRCLRQVRRTPKLRRAKE